MPINDKFISSLVDRMCVLPGPKGEMIRGDKGPDIIRGELGNTLKRFAKSNDHGKRMVDWLLFERPADSRTFRPSPGEIRDASEIVPAELPDPMQPADPECPNCLGDGVRYVQRGTYSGAAVCECRIVKKAPESESTGLKRITGNQKS